MRPDYGPAAPLGSGLIRCPHCGEFIRDGATKCPHCTGDIVYQSTASKQSAGTSLIVFVLLAAITYYIAHKWLSTEISVVIAVVFALFGLFSGQAKKG